MDENDIMPNQIDQRVKQNSPLSFEFDLRSNRGIVEWLIKDCSWSFQIHYVTADEPWYGDLVYQVNVTFIELRGAIEFKLRFG